MPKDHQQRMTSAERKELRTLLTDQGFSRYSFTADPDGRGVYTELWTKGSNTIRIQWAERKPV